MNLVDYLGVSPQFATPTKTDTKAPWGLHGLQQVRAATTLPLVAIGGLHAGNAVEVLRAGVDGLALVSALCSAAATLRALCLEVFDGEDAARGPGTISLRAKECLFR